MPDTSSTALIVGLLTLGGVLLGGLLSFLVEALRRRWAVSDRSYNRTKEILDRRCDQAEAYAHAATEDFRRVMHDAEAFLKTSDPREAQGRLDARRARMEQFDVKVFALGPAIRALGPDRLLNPWEAMMKQMDILQDQGASRIAIPHPEDAKHATSLRAPGPFGPGP